MNVLRNVFFALFAFAIHMGVASATTSGIPIHTLSILAICCVWLQKSEVIGFRLLPAALLVDLMQPTRVPVTVLTVLVSWLIASVIQKHWLTNHSVASLFGIAILATITRIFFTWVGIVIAFAVGTSGMAIAGSWNWVDMTLRLIVEIACILFLSIFWRSLQRTIRRTFIYGTS